MDHRVEFFAVWGSFDDESGATAIEYALVAGLMALVCVAAFTQLGVIMDTFYSVTSALVDAAI